MYQGIPLDNEAKALYEQIELSGISGNEIETIIKHEFTGLDDEAQQIYKDVNLLRESFIFLTLTHSVIVQKTLRDTVESYGNPRSDVYHSVNSADSMKDIFSLIQTAVRCLGAFGDREDADLLNTIKIREEDFCNLKKGFLQNTAHHRQSVKKLMTVVEEGLQRLSFENI